MAKIKVSLSIEQEAWKKFRVACIQKGVTASAEIEKFIASVLAKKS
jgi:hypothetical protein